MITYCMFDLNKDFLVKHQILKNLKTTLEYIFAYSIQNTEYSEMQTRENNSRVGGGGGGEGVFGTLSTSFIYASSQNIHIYTSINK